MDVPDPVTVEWIDRSISGLTDDALIDVVATLRARGGRQAELVDRVLFLRGKLGLGAERGTAPLGAAVIEETAVDPGRVAQDSGPVAPGRGADLSSGERFAGYVIEGLAGRGGMGVVYRARQMRPSRIVALKVISPELAGDRGFRRRFTSESEIAASLEHSNVIPVYEVGEASGRLFIAMRFVQGTDLGRLIAAEGRVPPRRAVQILAQLTSALDAAHARALVHRDVKPANLLIAREGSSDHVYLTDFGLAKFAVSGGLTRTGMFVGTIDYAAPEQFGGARVDARTDVYGAGCVLYNMLTGSVPFPREGDTAIMWAHISALPPSVRAAVPTLPGEFDAVIARAMAKDPGERYPSAGDLGRDALAAAERRRATIRERSIATGKAAPVAGTLHGPLDATEVPGAPSRAGAGAIPPAGGSGDRRSRAGPDRPRPRALISAITAAALVAIAAALLVVTGAFNIHKNNPPTTPAKTPTVTTTLNQPELPPAPTTKTFTDLKVGISFAYPASWQRQAIPRLRPPNFGVAAFGTGTAECALVVLRGQGPASSSQPARFAFVRSRQSQEARGFTHYQVLAIQAERGVDIAGVGVLTIADLRGDRSAWFFRGRDIYLFICTTRAAELNRVDQQAFRPLIASFTVG